LKAVRDDVTELHSDNLHSKCYTGDETEENKMGGAYGDNRGETYKRWQEHLKNTANWKI
jgi:hypothetical protein